MKENLLISRLAYLGIFAGLSGVIIMLFLTFVFQILFHELPCPLCLLQRLGFFGVALGFLLNLRYGLRPSHYSIVILSALFTGFVALRQIALHIVPGTGAYGDAFLGLHLYTWSFIISMTIIIMASFMLGIDRQYGTAVSPLTRFRLFTSLLFVATLIVVGMDIITVLLQCGIGVCPDNPTHYFFPFKV
jgi:disulfide bond formation protein DsbB